MKISLKHVEFFADLVREYLNINPNASEIDTLRAVWPTLQKVLGNQLAQDAASAVNRKQVYQRVRRELNLPSII